MNDLRVLPFRRDPLAFAAAGEGAGSRFQYFDVDTVSRWFDTLAIGELPAHGSDDVRQFPAADGKGSAETWYFITSGTAEFVQPDGRVDLVSPYDGIYLGAGTGGQLRAGSQGLQWLVLGSDGGQPSLFSAAQGRGRSTLNPAGAAQPAEVFRRALLAPRQWPSNTVGASAKPYWFYTVDDHSKWFHSACISCIAPGGATALHSHIEAYEGPYESWYVVLSGTGLLRNEYEDFLFEGGPGGAFVPANTSHQLINNGTDFLWYLTISSRGTEPLRVDTYSMPAGAERPGYLEEYNRILAARADRGLPVP
ncbi:cupin domain-containing protein [Novosphingobium sp. BL-52-GroH]|uniref:cupin domain-containing protein n=1 Tax=Novosphingobium sp. BL-52-GroH TaxID=3349877 RepID=UPI00384AD9DC